MTFAPIGSGAYDPALRPILETVTVKQWSAGYMLNGKHVDELEPLQVYVDIMAVPDYKCFCSSCGKQIYFGDLAGNGTGSFRGWHCVNCIVLPEAVTAWKIGYRMKRRSSKNPKGMKYFFIANTREICQKYISDMTQEFGEVEVEQVYPKPGESVLLVDSDSYRKGLIDRKADIVKTLSVNIRLLSEEEQAELRHELLEIDSALGKLSQEIPS